MHIMFRICCLFVLLVVGHHLHAQPPLRFQPITGANGISLGKINAITHDKNGYLWLSDQTNRCIIRYDGHKMVRYQNHPLDKNSLGGYYPECLLADSTGNIWIGFFGMGLDKLDPHTNTFTHFRHDKNDPNSLANDSVNAIVTDNQGRLWVGTAGGLDLFDEKTGRFTHYKHDPNDSTSLSWNLVRSLLVDRKGDLWAGTGLIWSNTGRGGLNRFNPGTNNFTRFVHDPEDPASLSENNIRSMLEDSYGNFWVGSGGVGIQTLDRQTGKFTQYPFDPRYPERLSRSKPRHQYDHITFIEEDADRHIWFGTYAGGIVRYNPATRKVDRIDGALGRSSVFDTTGWAAHTLDDGTVWIGTELSNFFKIDVKQAKLPYVHDPGVGYHKSLVVGNERWMCTTEGLQHKNLITGAVREYPIDPQDPKALHGDPHSIRRDRSGRYWVATHLGLNYLDPSQESFSRLVLDSTPSGAQPGLLDVKEDSKGRLWVTSFESGLFLVDETRKKIRHFLPDPQNQNSISSATAIEVLELKDDKFLISTANNGGFNIYDVAQDKWTRSHVGLNGLELEKDKTGTIWAASDAGLFRYDTTRNQLIPISTDGKVSNDGEVRGMAVDAQNNIWYCSVSSIFRLNAERDMVTEFGEYYLAEGTQFNHSSMTTLGDQVMVGATNGYYLFNPDSVTLNHTGSRISFSGFWINNKQQLVSPDGPLKKPIQTNPDIRLNYNQNTFSFTASVINFKTEANSVQYQLEPYDEQWRTAQSEEPFQYYNIPPGKYVLKVRSQSMEGRWEDHEMSIIIDPPWWRTGWAYAVYAIMGLLILFGLDRFQRSRIRAQERLRNSERELEHAREIEKAYHQLQATQAQLIQSEKMASLGELTAGIAHEIQNPLNFVNNFAEINSELGEEMREALQRGDGSDAEGILKMMADNEQKILHHGKRADAIVKSMLQHSRSSFGVKESTDINVLADEYLRLSYHGLRAKDKTFQSDYSFTPDLAIGKINVVQQDIGRVLLNLINNAFYAVKEKAASGLPDYKPMVEISTARQGNFAILTVKDNGKGMPETILQKIFQPFFTTKPTGEGTGLGLSLSYDIIKAHGGEIKVESEEGEGTVFTVTLPIG